MRTLQPPTASIRNSCDDAGPVVTLTNPSRKPRTFLVTWYGADAVPHPRPVTVVGGAPPVDVVLTVPERELVEVEATLGSSLLASLSFARDCTPIDPPEEHHALWSDPLSWHDGVVPGPSDVAHVDHCVVLDMDASVAGVMVDPGGILEFLADTKVTLESSANVVVEGALRMRPASPDVVHTLRFIDVDEQAFVGGGMEVLDTDVGLWAMGDGVLDLEGAEKTAWVNAGMSFAAGESAPVAADWPWDDEIVVTPTQPGHVTESYDRGVVGFTLEHDHPAVEVAPGHFRTAEVLNLTRNVRIEGTPGHRSHVKMSTTGPQTVRYVEFSHLGPRRMVIEDGKSVSRHPLGRWPVHFHMMEEASRGSLLEGCVIHDAGTHAFVAHKSHGVTFRDCIAHAVTEAPYWWDTGQEVPVGEDDPPSNDIRYERCVASLVRMGDPDNQHHAYLMGKGTGNVATGCVAVGVEDGHGFLWTTRSEGIWTFEANVAHNNGKSGSRFWGNNKTPQVFTDFVSYHNGEHGSFAGAYRNTNQYVRSIDYGNGVSAHELVALSKEDAPGRIIDSVLDGGGVSDYALTTGGHQLATDLPVFIINTVFRGGRVACIHLQDTTGGVGHMIQCDGCTFEGEVFVAEPGATGFLVIDGVEVWRA